MYKHFEYNTIFNDTRMNNEVYQYYIIPILYQYYIQVLYQFLILSNIKYNPFEYIYFKHSFYTIYLLFYSSNILLILLFILNLSLLGRF